MRKMSLDSMELSENNLYIGTSDGHIIHYELSWDKETCEFSKRLVMRKSLGVGRKSVDSLFAVPIEGKLFACCDGSLFTLQLDTLCPSTGIATLRSLTAVSPDLLLQSPYRLCVAKLRNIQLYSVSDNTMSLDKDIRLSDGASVICKFDRTVCAADSQSYKLIHLDNGDVVPLFPYDRNIMQPIICGIGINEFLLVIGTPQMIGLGVFVTAKGDAIRGTLEWPSIPKSVAFQFPYIISLLRNNAIEIHNLFTQELVQTIHIPVILGPRFLISSAFTCDLHDKEDSVMKVVVACRDGAVGLRMAGFETQINDLLESRNIESAIKLAENITQGRQDLTTSQKTQHLRDIYSKAGFMYLKETLFEDALALFEKAHLDPAIFVVMFPEYSDMLKVLKVIPGCDSGSISEKDSGGTSIIDYTARLGNIEDVVATHLEKNFIDVDEENRSIFKVTLLKNAKEILVKYLSSSRAKSLSESRLEMVDTVLMTVYSAENNPELYHLLSSSNSCAYDITVKTLTKAERYHGLGLFYDYHSERKNALDVWLRILKGEYSDPDFGGINQLVSYLAHLDDDILVLEYSPILLKLDPQLGAKGTYPHEYTSNS